MIGTFNIVVNRDAIAKQAHTGKPQPCIRVLSECGYDCTHKDVRLMMHGMEVGRLRWSDKTLGDTGSHIWLEWRGDIDAS